jgi:hypothetical protein
MFFVVGLCADLRLVGKNQPPARSETIVMSQVKKNKESEKQTSHSLPQLLLLLLLLFIIFVVVVV